ncbi:MAG TPA: DUF4231 domain-containing protein [Bryobacteraceae bacterium]|nr:DUF4231 domain-containing protein [Bryobacteraceae bacterium]
MSDIGENLRQSGESSRQIQVAVTGHRDVADHLASQIADQCRSAFEAISDPSSGQGSICAIRLFSCYAKGVDQLVARIARDAHIPVVAVIPVKLRRYRKAETIEKKLLRGIHIVRIEDPNSETDQDAYAVANSWMLQRCDVLIAVWDGEESTSEGGTAAAVAMALRRGLPIFWIPSSDPSAARWLNPVGSPVDLPEECCEWGGLTPEEAYRCADRRAEQLGGRHRLIIRAIYALSALAAVAAISSLELPWAGWIELIALGAIGLLVHRAPRSGVTNKWMRYRVLAEELRLALLGARLGIVPPAASESDGSARELARRIAQQAHLPKVLGPIEIDTFIAAVRAHLHVQLAYHRSVADAGRLRAVRLRLIRENVFAASLLITTVHLLFHPEMFSQVPAVTLMFSIVGPVVVGALTALVDHTAPESLAKNSAAAASLLLRQHHALGGRLPSLANCIALFTDLCILQNTQLGTWQETILDRPIELPG